MIRFASTGVVVAALAIGCAAQSSPPSQRDPGSNAGVRSASLSVWKPSSQRIELTSFGFWQGSSGYAKDRGQLTAEQLAALEKLETTAPPTMEVYDGQSYRVRVHDRDGTVAEYRAAMGNVRDSDEGHGAGELETIDITTLEPFLSTFDCVAARAAEGTARETDAPLDPRSVEPEKTVLLPTDAGCINGVFLPSTCSDALFTFEVREAGTFDIVGGRCVETLSLRLYTGDRTTLLAESSPGTNERCFTLRHAFDVGTYAFILSKTNAAGCAAHGMAGDTSLRVQPVQ
jgi:hypothetical protein